jgi:hypothetical protein
MKSIYLVFVFALLLVSCEKPNQVPLENEKVLVTSNPWATEEAEVTAMVERMLKLVGNYEIESLDEMIDDKANLAISRYRNGEWVSSTITINEFFDGVKSEEANPYYEPVNEYKILINEGQLAFVWADATLTEFGVPRTRNIDNFTLQKVDGKWIFVNLSFTTTPLPDDQQTFDLELFAKAYSQAWSGIRPEFVAMFFAENGSLRINDGEASVGRAAITEVAQSFMTDLPDMVVRYDSLVKTDTGANFYWTLIATNTGPGGTGNKVNVQGYEEWILSEDGLVQTSQGHFPSEEYARQLKGEN